LDADVAGAACYYSYMGENFDAANANGATPIMLMRSRSRYPIPMTGAINELHLGE
jgi:hypothetical protein